MSDAMSYGPSALATPANAVTVIRLLISPLVFLLIVAEGSSWTLLGLWAVLASTDGVDGWIARRHGTTRSGAFLDPLADKVLVLGALYSLVYIGRFPWLPVAVLAVREIAITLYRSHVARRGLAIPARTTAKAKTALQSLAVGLAVLPPLDAWTWPADLVLWASVFMAVVSAVQYALDGRRAHTAMGEPAGAPHSPIG
jgi:CDP-diacylglycerol---glycerol-3-phosphate 3-phosphatidyltransferase